MEEKKGFVDWIKYKMKVLNVSDRHFFTFIWVVAIVISLLTVTISATVIASGEKREAKKIAEQEQAKKQAEEEAIIASLNDARAQKASITDAESWKLVLVNLNHPLPDDFKIDEFTDLVNGHKVDKRMYEDLQKMFDDARAQGQSPSITASYVTALEAGNIGSPCALDHTTGLSIDVTSADGETGQESLLKWFDEHAAEYGFIIRYPDDKYSVTGVKDAPNHLRYVGVDAAKAMKESGECLEEYLGSY